ncbi:MULTISPECIES: glutamate racemase [Sphingobacterium]|uniref:Glutamate racemase n=1 Tax=Sphingobacterium tenebrionis TaxID=3111775 RepID=A0ABU8I345_9SPHI|nr:glutamate racemase [Sphingobacterium sp. CZ-2]QBR11944.1 glutamate racemase [Sphingobacterium sp. CZ-2]
MENTNYHAGPIGIFDSGYGGLTVFKEIYKALPKYDYIYLGDNARVPYGTRSFETVYEFTKQCVFKLFDEGCNLVILACNTASAKALRSIQQNDLPPGKKVLGVIRPTSEVVDQFTNTNKVGILATQGTVNSGSYVIEINKFHPEIEVFQHACPLWVPIVENNEMDSEGSQFFVQEDLKELLAMSPDMDTILLACTHYPLLLPIIEQFVPKGINIISQGELVAESLVDYLKRHPEVDEKCSKSGELKFYTTDDPVDFNLKAELFFGRKIESEVIKVV